MNASAILLFAAMELVLCFTPGPAVLLVVSQAMRHGFAASMRGALGILTGNAIYFALSAAGLGALLLASKSTFELVRWIGAGYLVILGVRMLFAQAKSASDEVVVAKPRTFVDGLITQLANPKAVVFFTALLPQFIDPHGPVTQQFVILGVVSTIIEWPVLATYAILADRGRRLAARMHWIERCAGVLLVAAGLKLAATRA